MIKRFTGLACFVLCFILILSGCNQPVSEAETGDSGVILGRYTAPVFNNIEITKDILYRTAINHAGETEELNSAMVLSVVSPLL